MCFDAKFKIFVQLKESQNGKLIVFLFTSFTLAFGIILQNCLQSNFFATKCVYSDPLFSILSMNFKSFL